MADERTYIIPLRKHYLKSPKYRRTKRAVNALRSFLERHMKTKNVLIGPMLNTKLWENGIQNPPHHVKVTVVRDEKDDVVRAELFGFEFKKKEKKEKKEVPKGLAGKIQEKLAPEEKKESKEDKKEEPKKEHKEKKDAPKKEAPAKKEDKKAPSK